MANPQEIRKKIIARKAEKVAAEKAKFAQMRRVAEEDATSVEKDLINLADACSAQAEAYDILRENLDLIQPPKEASLKVRTAALRNYGKEFKRIAEETPQELQSALSEAYHSLDEQAGALEQLAEHLGIDLGGTPVEEAFAQEGIQELETSEEEGVPVGDVEEPEEKEAAGEGWSTDRDESGQPKNPYELPVPRAASSGSDAFVTDRDKGAKPQRPAKVEIPQAEGQAQTPGNKGAHVRPMKQIVPSGTPTGQPAEAFVKDIPQAEGMGQTPGNKAARRAARR